MNPRRTRVLAAASLMFAVTAATARPLEPLWLITAGEWRRIDAQQRLEQVRDYMRSFCARPDMAPLPVLHCIERDSRALSSSDAMFDVASTCVLNAS
jgi:hypothetical protein